MAKLGCITCQCRNQSRSLRSQQAEAQEAGHHRRLTMLRDADGDLFFGFCGTRVYVPDEDPRAEGIAEGVLRRFRERLREELEKKPADSAPANVQAQGPSPRPELRDEPTLPGEVPCSDRLERW